MSIYIDIHIIELYFVHSHTISGRYAVKICFPVQENKSLSSVVYNHFGSAPLFVVVNTETGEVSSINNGDQIHEHGACNPIAGLGGQQVDAIVVGGIGRGALHKINKSGLRVFQAQQGTIGKNMELFNADDLPEFMPGHSYGGHGHDHECSH
jgi:predicted Fe-Mo cluster-binding NifX family protein